MESTVRDHTLVFRFSERLDTSAAMSLQKEIVDSIATHDNSLAVRFDFTGVEFISSGFIRILMIVARMKGKRFSIVNISPTVRKILLLAAMDRFISMD
jgi:anti-anti-sigma factor